MVGNHVFHGNTRLCSSSSRISSAILIIAIVPESFFQFGSFLFFQSSAGFLFFCEQMDFRHPVGTFFCLTQQQAGERQHSSTLWFVKLPLTIPETRWDFTLLQDPTSQLPFHDSNSWLLSLSGTPTLSLLLICRKEQFSCHLSTNLSQSTVDNLSLFRFVVLLEMVLQILLVLLEKKRSSSFPITRTAKDLSFVVTPRLLLKKNLGRTHLQRFWRR